ncbi:MAG: SPOR domain-containing protein [Rhodobacter sp.]|nr:SPOR domain-containing protein [Rhodobacter sp.]MCA3460709.1 SPOR domain-containing protein [Rhodobacter sp.]MCA3465027.1 SPOR domain-containing protein [Rhodobacter sp.]MCA3468400.1 SPOR domain-containing protein [Rhodobacter sp.]MCA3471809.1 SPOR domain-containing protein [Rhodobacter sp.]
MAVVDDEDFAGYPSSSGPGRVEWLMNAAGAVTSVALVLGLVIWGYNLAVRDVSGIPVVRALEGPMRVAPQDPGGEVIAHTGLSVNDVAAEGAAAPLPDQIALAPRPFGLSPADQPVAGDAAVPPSDAPSSAPDGTVPPFGMIVPVDPVGQLTQTPLAAPPSADAGATDTAVAGADLSMEAAVESALAEALGAEPMQSGVLASAEPAPPGAVVRSPRPERRPEGDGSGDAILAPAALTAADAAPAGGEVDVTSIAAGTRLVQLGAFDDEAGARREWAQLQARFGELIAPKAMVLQKADSGGRSFVRLRALGFEDEADARRFCSALLAENASCIPVAHRP